MVFRLRCLRCCSWLAVRGPPARSSITSHVPHLSSTKSVAVPNQLYSIASTVRPLDAGELLTAGTSGWRSRLQTTAAFVAVEHCNRGWGRLRKRRRVLDGAVSQGHTNTTWGALFQHKVRGTFKPPKLVVATRLIVKTASDVGGMARTSWGTCLSGVTRLRQGQQPDMRPSVEGREAHTCRQPLRHFPHQFSQI